MEKFLMKSSSTGNLSAKRPAENSDWSIPKRTALPKDQAKYDANRQISENRFSALPADNDGDKSNENFRKAATTVKKSGHVPPLIMTIKEDYTHGQIKALVGKYTNRFHLQYKGNNKVAIICYSPEAHQNVKVGLRTDNAPFRTYTRKDERTPKVVIKGLPAQAENELSQELESLGFPSEKISKLRSSKSDSLPYPPFLVQLTAGTDIQKFRQIRYLFNCVVEIQKFKPNRSVTQCYRCQGFGHSSRNCNMPPRCVKCPGPHASSDCTKHKDDPPTCCNCREEHPANYRQCRARVAYMERLDKVKTPAIKSQKGPINTVLSQPAKPATARTALSTGSWAAVAAKAVPAPAAPNQENVLQEGATDPAVGEMLRILKIIRNLKQEFLTCSSMLDKVMLIMTHLGHYV
jgi:hypothetical protein